MSLSSQIRTCSDKHQTQLGTFNWNYTICAGATNHSRSIKIHSGFFCDWNKSPLFRLLSLLLRFSILCYAVKNRQSNCIDVKEAIELMLTVTFSS